MSSHSFIIRFPDQRSRDEFQSSLDGKVADHVRFGEFLPDVIVQDVSDQELEKIRNIVDPQAEFFEDVQFRVPSLDRSSGK